MTDQWDIQHIVVHTTTRRHLHAAGGGRGGSHGAAYHALLDGVDQFVGSHAGVKAAGTEIDVTAGGIGSGAHGIGLLQGGGIRFGGAIQEIEVKDFQLVNFGKGVSLESLPITVIK